MIRSITISSGVTLQYAERGGALGIPVVFLHGVTDSWRSFEPVLDRLPGTIRAFAITQRGHGNSSKPPDGYGYGQMAEDLWAFMDANEVTSAVVVGHSMGAFRTIHGHPGLQEFWDTAVSRLTDPIDPAFVRDFQVSTLARPVPPEFLNTVVSESLQAPARVWRAAFKEFLETPDFSHGLARFTGPALMAWGDRDVYAHREDQEALRRAIADSRLVTYAGAGHALHWEEPERFAADLVSFVYERR
jgi:non-heme chloroperoxidase